MTDRRTHPANDKVAHISLKGRVEAPRFTEGDVRVINVTRAPLLDAPDGGRDRELLLGESFLVLDDHDGFSFGQRVRDGYVGYVAQEFLSPPGADPTHVMRAVRSYAKPTADLKTFEPVLDLAFGTQVHVVGTSGDWSKVDLPGADRPDFIPSQHLEPLGKPAENPVAIARLFIGTPYLWGGNSAFGLDCSGLVQSAMLACNIDCPGDSDQQADVLGRPTYGAPIAGDLLFWRGHVAFAATELSLLHATAYAMAVIEEPLGPAMDRIAAAEGPLIAHRRFG
ncbi:MAG: C40 family peptidase [Marinibacterium sp.]